MINHDNIRALVRQGDKIGALRALRAEGASLASAQTTLAAIITPEDQAAFEAVRDARPLNPWVETAPGIFEPQHQTERK